jgi:hypothetical protein
MLLLQPPHQLYPKVDQHQTWQLQRQQQQQHLELHHQQLQRQLQQQLQQDKVRRQ